MTEGLEDRPETDPPPPPGIPEPDRGRVRSGGVGEGGLRGGVVGDLGGNPASLIPSGELGGLPARADWAALNR